MILFLLIEITRFILDVKNLISQIQYYFILHTHASHPHTVKRKKWRKIAQKHTNIRNNPVHTCCIRFDSKYYLFRKMFSIVSIMLPMPLTSVVWLPLSQSRILIDIHPPPWLCLGHTKYTQCTLRSVIGPYAARCADWKMKFSNEMKWWIRMD